MNTKTITATQARTEFFDLINAAKHGGQTTIITKNGKIAAKIVPEVTVDLETKQKETKKLLASLGGIFTNEDVQASQEFRRSFDKRLKSNQW